MFCGQCGSQLNPQAKFCHACGASRNAAGTAKPRSRAGLYWILGGVAVFVAVAIGINLNSGSAGSPTPTPTPVPIAIRERDLVRSYYSEISNRNLQAAYNRLSPSAKRDQEFSAWSKTYDTTLATSVSNMAAANGAVSFRLNRQDKTDVGTLTSVFDGTWRITNPGGLRLDNQSLSLLYTSYFLDNAPRSASTASTYGKLKQSLAFVFTETADGQAGSGTAFCIGSDASDSYYLTSLHVVPEGSESVIVPMNGSSRAVVAATVLFRDSDRDSAIIQSPIPAVPTLKLATSPPSEGQNIAIAGFPFMQIEIAQVENIGLSGLAPSLHLGTVNALVPDGSMIEFDATTDHGNSGGPLFDPATGVVYGVVTFIASGESQAVQGSFATSMQVLWPFIRQSKIRVITPSGPYQ
jgi:S1-C subfamily serine protease